MRFALVAAAMLTSLVPVHSQPAANSDSWPDLVTNVFGGGPIKDGSGVLSLDAPVRAEDAAIVPVTIRSKLLVGSDLRIRKVTLVIDENPSPVAAEFELGTRHVAEISTRVRVDAYSRIHAVAELSDGKLYGVEKFVKASGGCSAPASKNPGGPVPNLGEIRLRWFDKATDGGSPRSDALMEAQLMIRHPNNSGLQMDQIARTYTPAFFVRDLSVKVGDELLFRMSGGISISENPSFRFVYEGTENEPVTVEAIDTDENAFRGSWAGPGADAT
jgi:sulfur-oxidizing protein SoxY